MIKNAAVFGAKNPTMQRKKLPFELPFTLTSKLHPGGEMFKTVLKVTGALFILLVVAIVGLVLKANHTYQKVASEQVSEPELILRVSLEQGNLAEGARQAQMKGCFDCHGEDMGGKVFINDPMVGVFAGPNLTKGQGGLGATYTTADWVRAIRFGIRPNHQWLRFMPSQEFAALADQDLNHLIVYLQNLPPVDRTVEPIKVGPMAKILYMSGQMPLLFSGQNVDLKSLPPAEVAPSETPEYGRYLAAGCVGCHNPTFTGGPIQGVPPSWPHAANLTAAGNLKNWSFDQFKQTLKTGTTPEGKFLNPQFMPWTATAAMNDVELMALYSFFKSLPAGG